MKKAGALMPVSALPSEYGIGDLGDTAYKFVDILSAMGLKIWQVLPLNPLGFGNSPYQAYSSFAGDEIYISIDKLMSCGLLDLNLVKPFEGNPVSVDYIKVRQYKQPLLEYAFDNFLRTNQYQSMYNEFVIQNEWVTNYAIFLTFKKINNLQLWTTWPQQYKDWIKDKQLDLSRYKERIDYEIFIQFIFYWQWQELKSYANGHAIEIMGDIPIYLGLDSADVWINQELFLLDNQGNPAYVAGVPPDFFSVSGQRWGNPLYNWDKLVETGFAFWVERLRGNAKLFDLIRIDHFRAFDTYWQIPAECKTAVIGKWVEAPGYALLDKVFQNLPEIKIIAEDLGDLRPQVHELRNYYHLPGMQVFQFHFSWNGQNTDFVTNPNSVIYTGTHDNSTLLGWYKLLSAARKQQLKQFFKITAKGPQSIRYNLKQAIIKYILNCEAEYVIFPVQDILGLDNTTRLNTPARIGSPNWEWRLTDSAVLMAEVDFMHKAVSLSGR